MKFHGEMRFDDGSYLFFDESNVTEWSTETRGQLQQFTIVNITLNVGPNELRRSQARFTEPPLHFNARSLLLPAGEPREESEMLQARQGDVLLTKVAESSEDAERLGIGFGMLMGSSNRVEAESGRLVLARGEKTGHVHTVDADVAEFWTLPDGRRLVVREQTELTHDEHEPLLLEPGVYDLTLQEDWTEKAHVSGIPRWYED